MTDPEVADFLTSNGRFLDIVHKRLASGGADTVVHLWDAPSCAQ